MFFFFKQKTAYEMRISDWSSDVCSSDLTLTALWYLTGWQQAPGALLIGSVSIAFFGGADEAGAAIAQFARFAAIAAVAAALLCYVLLPLAGDYGRSEEHTSELQSLMAHLVCRLLLVNKRDLNHLAAPITS